MSSSPPATGPLCRFVFRVLLLVSPYFMSYRALTLSDVLPRSCITVHYLMPPTSCGSPASTAQPRTCGMRLRSVPKPTPLGTSVTGEDLASQRSCDRSRSRSPSVPSPHKRDRSRSPSPSRTRERSRSPSPSLGRESPTDLVWSEEKHSSCTWRRSHRSLEVLSPLLLFLTLLQGVAAMTPAILTTVTLVTRIGPRILPMPNCMTEAPPLRVGIPHCFLLLSLLLLLFASPRFGLR